MTERRWRLYDGERVKVSLNFEPRDLWVGVFWRWADHGHEGLRTFHAFVCILPVLPLHVSVLVLRAAND